MQALLRHEDACAGHSTLIQRKLTADAALALKLLAMRHLLNEISRGQYEREAHSLVEKFGQSVAAISS